MKKNTGDFLLTGTVTVKQTREWINQKDNEAKRQLVKLIKHRFYNRYTKHLHSIDSGFLKMGICCLTIETLESFKQGRENTKGISKKMFVDFFNDETANFPKFDSISNYFYDNVRCGILHQAETTNAWRILRSGPLLDITNRTINATLFVESIEQSLESYINLLSSSEFDKQIWKHAVIKLNEICNNCEISN